MTTSNGSPPSRPKTQLDVLIVDWHGGIRGKRLPVSMREKILKGETRIPLSTQAMDIWGDDRDEITGLGLSIGDPDALCIPDPDGLGFHAQPWNDGNEQILCSLHKEDGSASDFDVRSILQKTVDRLNADNLYPVVAVELEFYLMDASTRTTGVPKVPEQLSIAEKPDDLQLYDMRVMDRADNVLTLIHQYAQAMGIPAETSLAEFGPGQFEINLRHQSNPVMAADHAVLFKQLVDRAAHHEGLLATFMAKPYTEHGGSGQHVHVSLLDDKGENVFDSQTTENDNLLYAVSGCLDLMSASQLMFAPHANSYRRLQPDSFAPVLRNWGYDHRGVAIRLPETKGKSARLEHRVAGADACSYLVLATLLGSVHYGLKNRKLPDMKPLLPGETSSGDSLTHDWIAAINNFDKSTVLRSILGERFCNMLVKMKHHEARTFNRQVSNIDLATYLTRA
jgi:glutamine synthetase